MDRSMVGQVLRLAWPVLAQQALLISVGLYDQYLGGNYQPDDPALHVPYQSAQTTGNYLAWFLSSFTALVSVGATAMVARFIGARDPESAIRVTHQALILALVLGAVGSMVGLLLLPMLVHSLNLVDIAGSMAIQFLTPILVMLVFQVIESAGIACLIGAGDTKTGLVVLGGVAIFNIPLAWFFLQQFGFPGIALGTSISHMIGCFAVLAALAIGRGGLRLRTSLFRPVPDLMRRLLRISIPASIDSLSMGLCQLWFLSLVNRLGDTAAAAHGIAIRWESLGYLSGMAFGTAASALVGQNLGAGRFHDARRAGWIAFGMGAVTMTIMGAVFYTLAPDMFRLFCPAPEQQPIIEVGVPALRLVAFAMPSLACTIVFTHALRGAGDTRVPVLFTWFGFLVVRIPLAYLFTRSTIDLGSWGTIPGYDLGLFGAWLAMFIDLVLRGVFFVVRFAGGRWQSIQV